MIFQSERNRFFYENKIKPNNLKRVIVTRLLGTCCCHICRNSSEYLYLSRQLSNTTKIKLIVTVFALYACQTWWALACASDSSRFGKCTVPTAEPGSRTSRQPLDTAPAVPISWSTEFQTWCSPGAASCRGRPCAPMAAQSGHASVLLNRQWFA